MIENVDFVVFNKIIENEDYTSFDNFIKRETGGSVQIEYALSIDAAKELSIVEGNGRSSGQSASIIEPDGVSKVTQRARKNKESASYTYFISTVLSTLDFDKVRNSDLIKTLTVCSKLSHQDQDFEHTGHRSNLL